MFLFALLEIACACGAAPVQAEKSKEAPAEKRKDYDLKVIRVGKTFQAMRLKVSTGESWIMDGEKYVKVPEAGAIPAGDYEITLVTDDTDWMAFRIDRQSGATWQLRGGKWAKVKEPEAKTP
jgi:hypothetical protein